MHTHWDRAGVVVEVQGRKYFIKLHGSGRVISRNRRFIKPSPPIRDDSLIFAPSNITTSTSTTTMSVPCSAAHAPPSSSLPTLPSSTNTQSGIVPLSTSTHHETARSLPLALRRLLPHNKPGLSEN